MTVVDAYLAGCVLVGIGLNAALGWWWADPVASLVIVFYGFKPPAPRLGRRLGGRGAGGLRLPLHPFVTIKAVK